MTATPARVLLATLVVVAFAGAVGLVSADTDTSNADDRIGEMMPHDHGGHHDADHNHGDYHDIDHDHGDYHDGDHNHGDHHDGESQC